ncbi:V-set domain-containing T-cell activation inhibitor 1 isoform X1 [Acipenser ruthenus]|uniref:V-set domain-containing T-cell activation inhibitor 1 isoform X1 n=1 Tax=Acipenser ruthenus TaxID=7906 RepID=UPI00145B4122|nr:V-set domain-containing T-cell activation inhibitor 1 isoform X1 [Acipenser ruthenus]
MATIGQIIFGSMIAIIFILAGIIILILATSLGGNAGSMVESRFKFPVGNLDGDVMLDCKFIAVDSGSKPVTTIMVTWEKEGLTGVVHKYASNVNQLQEQNPSYKDRTLMFPDQINNGNASLLLRNVQWDDEGSYTCSVSNSNGQGKVNVNLRVAAYSAPKFTIEATGQAATLKAVAQRWYPKPTVSWTDFNGANLTGETEFSNNSAGIFKVTSVLKTVKVDDSYDCIIENALVKSVSNALVTDSGVTEKNYFKMNSAALPLPHWLIFSFHFPLWTYWILS